MQQLPTRAAIFFNLTNQFNSVSREEFFNVISTSFPELLPLTTLFYENAGTVHHKWDDGSWRTLLMKEGVSQGCPLSLVFASFVIACLLEPIDKLLRQCASDQLASGDPGNDGFGGVSHLLGYVDDISSCVYLHDLPFLCNTLKSLGASLGCFVNSSKHASSLRATALPLSLSFTLSAQPSQLLSQLPSQDSPHIRTPQTNPHLPSLSSSPRASVSLVTQLDPPPLPPNFSPHKSTTSRNTSPL